VRDDDGRRATNRRKSKLFENRAAPQNRSTPRVLCVHVDQDILFTCGLATIK